MISSQQLSKYGSAVLLVFAALALFLAQSAYWVNHTVFDQANFSQITTSSLLSQSSRDAIATAVVDKSLANRPLVKRVIGDRATSLISGLLGSDLGTQAVETITSKTYAYATASNRQDIKIDLTAIKTPLSSIISLSQKAGNSGDALSSVQDQIPDEITLVSSNSFPDLSGVVKTMLWLGPLLWLSTIVLFGTYIYIGRAMYAKRVYMVGGAIIIVSFIGLLTSPFVPPPVAAAVPNIQLRPVVENLTIGFLEPFKTQMYYMLALVLVALLIFNQRFNIFTTIKSLGSRLEKKPAKKSVGVKVAKPKTKSAK